MIRKRIFLLVMSPQSLLTLPNDLAIFAAQLLWRACMVCHDVVQLRRLVCLVSHLCDWAEGFWLVQVFSFLNDAAIGGLLAVLDNVCPIPQILSNSLGA